jgi:hypothetical protein
MEEHMKKSILILFAVIITVGMQSCDNPLSETAQLANTKGAEGPSEFLSESDAIVLTAYSLVEGSTLYVSTSPDGPIVAVPITGAFSLTPAPSPDNLCRYFSVSGLAFESKDHNPRYAGKAGNGKYELCVASSVKGRQRMAISVSIGGSRLITMDSGQAQVPPDIKFPWIDVTMKTVSVSADITFPSCALRIVAVPMKDIAFTTTYSFTSGSSKARVNHGDLLSARGKIILTSSELIKGFNLWPTFAMQEPGLDAIHMPALASADSARPSVFFSTDKDILADDTPGQGDILDSSGKIVMRNKELVAPFGPMPVASDAGLDALQVYPCYSPADKPMFLFSVKQGFFSENLGVYISPGDLLLTGGKVFMTEAKLLRNYKPVDATAAGIGVDAVALRWNSEVWFSVNRDFQDARLGRVGNGDVLSDNGRIVCRNRDLLAGFDPLEDLADFGLDGVSITE